MYRVTHGSGHRISHREARAESGSQSSAASGILRGITHCLRRFELGVLAHVAQHAHRRSFVHRCFDVFRQGNVFDHELGELETKRLEFILEFLFRELTQLIIV